MTIEINDQDNFSQNRKKWEWLLRLVQLELGCPAGVRNLIEVRTHEGITNGEVRELHEMMQKMLIELGHLMGEVSSFTKIGSGCVGDDEAIGDCWEEVAGTSL
ncbi:hypothetical protein HAX54_046379 [Datura stramonium]|uniref:Uncharacterized protein n=1 Tax=Datura stramonium TaxID=4076 RepID=A0ABS8SRT3_DATST|nr:hypothetical protein [Datura stramonium]